MDSVADKEACPLPGMDTTHLSDYYIMFKIQQKMMKHKLEQVKKKTLSRTKPN